MEPASRAASESGFDSGATLFNTLVAPKPMWNLATPGAECATATPRAHVCGLRASFRHNDSVRCPIVWGSPVSRTERFRRGTCGHSQSRAKRLDAVERRALGFKRSGPVAPSTRSPLSSAAENPEVDRFGGVEGIVHAVVPNDALELG